jgi:hypothetical protein
VAEENDLLDLESIDVASFVGLSSVTFTGLGGSIGDPFQIDDLAVAVLEPMPIPLNLLALGTLLLLSCRE